LLDLCIEHYLKGTREGFPQCSASTIQALRNSSTYVATSLRPRWVGDTKVPNKNQFFSDLWPDFSTFCSVIRLLWEYTLLFKSHALHHTPLLLLFLRKQSHAITQSTAAKISSSIDAAAVMKICKTTKAFSLRISLRNPFLGEIPVVQGQYKRLSHHSERW
jgi:hypothetical protein